MLIIKLKGGLGNQLFQYAYGRLLSIKNNVPVKYTFSGNKNDIQREYKLDYFNTKIEIATDEEIKETRSTLQKIPHLDALVKKILRQFNMGYSAKSLEMKSGYLEGFWQSHLYLEPIRKQLLEEITLKNNLPTKDILAQIESTNSICVNVRRGDYVSNVKNKLEWATFGMEYYEKAFALIKTKVQNPTLFVMSDDIAWCKENIKTDIPTVFFDADIPDYEAFMIATYCKHNIITNSSFAFWIAWLNQNPNKIVIAPKKWNNRYQAQYKDLLPTEWITL